MSAESLRLSALPLFPLGTVLFPQGSLSLRIFEVRYLDLIAKCHKANAPFGVVLLREGSEVQRAGAAHEQLESAGTLAHVMHIEQVQAGLLHVICRGGQRFHIDRQERLKHGLWVADITLMRDDALVGIPEDLAHTATALQELRASLAQRGELSLNGESESYDDCGWVANRWCELLPLPSPLKQQLMILDNPLVRLELVSDFLKRPGA